MGKTSSIAIVACLLAACLNGALPALCQPTLKLRQAIKAYQDKDYRGTLAALKGVSPKDELAHYYRALAYQQIGDRKEAESEYRFCYEHGKSKDLVCKSWQGLQGLTKVRGSRTLAQAAAVVDPRAVAQGTQTLPDTSVYVKPPEWIINVTPGCGRHSHN